VYDCSTGRVDGQVYRSAMEAIDYGFRALTDREDRTAVVVVGAVEMWAGPAELSTFPPAPGLTRE